MESPMTLVRMTFLALAVLLPTTWTIARAEDKPAAGEAAGGEAKKEKKAKKGKKAEGGEEKKAEEKK
jgi:hypothetical protein